MELDFSLITVNNPDQNVTNTDNLKPETKKAINELAGRLKGLFPSGSFILTGGAEKGYHAKSATGNGHEDGVKFDFVMNGADYDTVSKIAHEMGMSCVWEGDHFDLCVTGVDSRDPQAGYHSTSLFADYYEQSGFARNKDKLEPINNVDLHVADDWNGVEAFAQGAWTQTKSSGVGRMVASMWGKAMYGDMNNSLFGATKKPSQEDIDYVKTLLPNNPTAVNEILTKGSTSEEIRYQAEHQAQLEKEWKEIEAYNQGCLLTLANVGVLASDFIADPTNLLPLGTAYKGLKMLERLGNAYTNVNKIHKYAIEGAKLGSPVVGASAVASVSIDNVLRDAYGNESPDYVTDSLMAFAGGTVLGKLAQNGMNTSYGRRIAQVAEQTEDEGLRGVADLPKNKILMSIHNKLHPLKSKIFAKMNNISAKFEQGYNGYFRNAPSRTLQEFAVRADADARMREKTNCEVTAMDKRMNYENHLQYYFMPIIDVMKSYLKETSSLYPIPTQQAMDNFGKMVIQRFNQEYAGHYRGVVLPTHPLVEEAVRRLKSFRDEEMLFNKQLGNVEESWQAVYEEFSRHVNLQSRQRLVVDKFRGNLQEAERFLTEYARRYVIREACRSQMLRDIERQNRRLQEAGEELLPMEVTEADLDRYIEESIHNTVQHWLYDNFDANHTNNTSAMGTLTNWQRRTPIDTSGQMALPDGSMFSFDENLRHYDLQGIVSGNIRREAGEASVRHLFADIHEYEEYRNTIRRELEEAKARGEISSTDIDEYMTNFENYVNELRGYRGKEEALTQLEATVKILKNFTYMVQGGNMGFCQLGELGGMISYLGMKEALKVFPRVIKHLTNKNYTPEDISEMERVAYQLRGAYHHLQVFGRQVRDDAVYTAFSKNTPYHKMMRGLSDAIGLGTKITSTVNFLPRLTRAMTTQCDIVYIGNIAKWAHKGDEKGISNTVFKACGLRDEGLEAFRRDIQRYIQVDENGIPVSIDENRWWYESPYSFDKFQEVVRRHTERAILSAEHIGQRNMLINSHPVLGLIFEFKDFTLRGMDAMFMRGLTHREKDDMLAFVFTMLTGMMAYSGRKGIEYAYLKTTGQEREAEELEQKYFNEYALLNSAITRSSMLTPVSIGLDTLNLVGMNPLTTRTTVSQKSREALDLENLPKTFFTNMVRQTPALTALEKPLTVIQAPFTGVETQKEMKDLLEALMPNNSIPLVLLSDYMSHLNDLPKK